jgi:hypothetical protein
VVLLLGDEEPDRLRVVRVAGLVRFADEVGAVTVLADLEALDAGPHRRMQRRASPPVRITLGAPALALVLEPPCPLGEAARTHPVSPLRDTATAPRRGTTQAVTKPFHCRQTSPARPRTAPRRSARRARRPYVEAVVELDAKVRQHGQRGVHGTCRSQSLHSGRPSRDVARYLEA